MIRIITGTFIYKIVTALVNFAAVALTSQFLGAEGKGVTTIFIANITINLLVSQILGGTALTYLASRKNSFQLITISYIWTIISCVIVSLVLGLLRLTPGNLTIDLLLISTLHGLFGVNAYLLVGKEKVNEANFLYLAQNLCLLILLFVFFILLDSSEVISFIKALKISFLFVFLISFLLLSGLSKITFSGISDTLKDLFSYGLKGQASNVVQFFNYRLNYYYLSFLSGEKEVGIFSIGVALAEAIWLLGRSIGIVQYSRISNRHNKAYARIISFQLAKVSFFGTAGMLVVLLLLPESFFTYLFGKDFSGTSRVIATLAPGILSIGTSMVFTNYFAGLGKYEINNKASVAGFITIVISGYFLTKNMGMVGSGISMSLSYMSSSLYYFYQFRKHTRFRILDLFPTGKDLKAVLSMYSKP